MWGRPRRPPAEDAGSPDPGEAVPAVRGRQPGQAPGPLQEARLCPPVDGGPQPDVPQDRVAYVGAAHRLGRRACPRPHHIGQAHAQTARSERMDGMLAGTARHCPAEAGGAAGTPKPRTQLICIHRSHLSERFTPECQASINTFPLSVHGGCPQYSRTSQQTM